jgi:hypothetical protein
MKNLSQFKKNYSAFTQKNFHQAPKKYRDPGPGKNLLRVPDSGVKKEPDPGSGFATLTVPLRFSLRKNEKKWQVLISYLKLNYQFDQVRNQIE